MGWARGSWGERERGEPQKTQSLAGVAGVGGVGGWGGGKAVWWSHNYSGSIGGISRRQQSIKGGLH